jgi:hypothetical protein
MQIVEEAGGAVTRMDGGKFCVFDRSILVSNGVLHEKVNCHWWLFHNYLLNITVNKLSYCQYAIINPRLAM